MSISRIFDISKRALLTNQSAIRTTAQNIANVNTEGYTRRRVDLSKIAFGFGGLNSRITMRLRNRFVENQLTYENQNLRKYQSDEMILTQVEGVFSEPLDSGLSNILSEFWNSWSDLANDPESQQARSLVRDKGVLLANTFNRIYGDLKNLQNQINVDIQNKVMHINQLLNNVSSINEQIGANVSDDLLDQRDLLVSELSSLINIDVQENSNGGLTVSTGGQILVSGSFINELVVDKSVNNNSWDVEIKLSSGNQRASITSGELGSLIENNNRHIPDILEKLNILARDITVQVNSIHSNGYNIDGLTGVGFFEENVTGASDFKVSSIIFDDPSLIATASGPDTPGDGSIAQAISDVQFDSFVQGNTVSDFYNALISSVGNKVQEANFLSRSQEMVVQNLIIQRESVSGVSLEEEMTKLVEYEQAYQAAARMVTTVDEMTQTILNMV